jgi:hypothetical protein
MGVWGCMRPKIEYQLVEWQQIAMQSHGQSIDLLKYRKLIHLLNQERSRLGKEGGVK